MSDKEIHNFFLATNGGIMFPYWKAENGQWNLYNAAQIQYYLRRWDAEEDEIEYWLEKVQNLPDKCSHPKIVRMG